ncbi:MAG TPA: thioredoxin domain-containing protein [Pyrinomonadaceae bacterium]|nr:thioredoxin domain-containing protein [Pyrinomonadaceae bacterium]
MNEVVRLKNDVNERDHVLGPSSAPVTLLEYGDFECVDCGMIYPTLKEVRQLLSTSLRFVYRHFPLVKNHPHSMRAAEASEAADAQEKFWQMHDELFKHQESLDDKHLQHYARRIGLNTDRFANDMANHTFLKQIQTDYQLSLFDEHITGTPTLYLNSVQYTGAVDSESLLLAIKAADTEGLINLPEHRSGLRHLLERLRQKKAEH